MKNLILIISILLAVSCGKGKEAQTKTKAAEDNNTKPIKVTDTNAPKPIKTDDNNATKPVKELTLGEKVVGTYEFKRGEYTYKWVLLENGIWKHYEISDKSAAESKWRISKDGELYFDDNFGYIRVFRINPDGSITDIAEIDMDGIRKDFPKEFQATYKKIK